MFENHVSYVCDNWQEERHILYDTEAEVTAITSTSQLSDGEVRDLFPPSFVFELSNY